MSVYDNCAIGACKFCSKYNKEISNVSDNPFSPFFNSLLRDIQQNNALGFLNRGYENTFDNENRKKITEAVEACISCRENSLYDNSVARVFGKEIIEEE